MNCFVCTKPADVFLVDKNGVGKAICLVHIPLIKEGK